jgi:hyaluronoglucosaminidase
VTPIDVATGTPDTAIRVGQDPVGVAFTPDGRTAYVTNHRSDSVTPIDVATGRTGRAIRVGNGPNGVAFTPNGRTAYVTNLHSDSVTPIHVGTSTPGTAIRVGDSPFGVAFTPNARTAYVANVASDTVTPIAVTIATTSRPTAPVTGTPGTAIGVGRRPEGVAFVPDHAARGAAVPLIADSGFRPKVDGFSFANDGGGPVLRGQTTQISYR